MDNKRASRKVQGITKDNLSCIRKIIEYQEELYNVRFRNGKWVRRYNVRKKNKTK